MGPKHQNVLLALLLAACGGEKEMQMMQSDAPIQQQQGCTAETDCGGTTPYCETSKSECVQCRFSSHCAASSGVCDGNVCRAPRSCQELHDQLPALQSGVYKIDVDDDGPEPAVDAYCDMTIDGGGWTLIQRTRWAWAASQALSTNFDTWHDTSIGTPGVGAAYRLAGKHWPALLQMKQLMVSHRLRTSGGSACSPLWYVATNVTLAVDKTAKSAEITTITQPIALVATTSGTAVLSTTDSGASSAQCVTGAGGVPWFYTSCCSTCPTYAGTYWTDATAPHPMVSYTGTTADFFGHLETDVCSNMAVQMSEAGAYRGVDTMEMYIR